MIKKSVLICFLTSSLFAAQPVSPGIPIGQDQLNQIVPLTQQLSDTLIQLRIYTSQNLYLYQQGFIIPIPGSKSTIFIPPDVQSTILDGQNYLTIKNQLIQEINQLP